MSPAPFIAAAERLVERLAAEHPLYLVVDAARDETLLHELIAAGAHPESLYEGAPPGLDAVAPHLLEVASRAVLERFVAEGWGDACGIAASCPEPPNALRRHLRRLLLVEREDDEKLMYFRFYDPRVLRRFVPTCDAEQLRALFGPIRAFWCEGDDPHELCTLCLTGGRLDTRREDLFC